MCGRYTLTTPAEELAEIFEVSESVDIGPRYNVAPTQQVAVIGHNQEGQRALGLMRWGLVPHWAKDPSIGNRMINARGETAAEKPSFRSSFKKRRCLVLADGFYEWKKVDGGRKQPYYIRLKEHRPFAIAGLWARWRPRGDEEAETLLSCTLITTAPNEFVGEIHDRMPVILPASAYDLWLDPEVQDREILQPLLTAYDPEAMEAFPVSTAVNSPANDRAELIAPLG
ncbi:MAG: SOS response-associated peptidase [Acidobacteriota bacterium]